MAIEIVDFPIKNGGSFHCYVSSPEGRSFLEIFSHQKFSWNVLDPIALGEFASIKNDVGIYIYISYLQFLLVNTFCFINIYIYNIYIYQCL